MSAGAMGLWHGVEYFEKEKINDDHNNVELFVKAWDPLVREFTSFRYDWSYIVAWVGVGMCLASASLFAMAGFCIKSDREHEEAMNMQYLMPVYPQKGQPYGPYGYAAYPGPAAYYGSQYGLPYSQYWFPTFLIPPPLHYFPRCDLILSSCSQFLKKLGQTTRVKSFFDECIRFLFLLKDFTTRF